MKDARRDLPRESRSAHAGHAGIGPSEGWRRVFVGRSRELGTLGHALDEAAAGTGLAVLVAGEPGIGKTRTVLEFARVARGDGAQVLVGSCYEGDWAGAYRPFASALTEYVETADPGQLRADLGFAAPPLVELVPLLRERLTDVSDPVPLPPDEARGRLFEAVGQFLVSVSLRKPVVVVIDDLHWADADTLAMLRYVAHRAARHRLLLVGTYRQDELGEAHPLASLLATLRSETRCEDLLLGGLSRPDMERLVTSLTEECEAERALHSGARSPADPMSALVAKDRAAVFEALHAETRGNPFFVREIVLRLDEERPRDGTSEAWLTVERLHSMDVPRGVRQVVDGRLARLSPAARALLVAGAGFDGPFELAVAAAVAELSEGAALDAVEAAMRAHLLCPAAGLEEYDFAHSLIRRTVRVHLTPSLQVRLHRRIAQALERVRGAGAEACATAVAYHYHRSATLPGAEQGTAAALVAGAHAEARGAFDQAVTFHRIALDLMPPDDARRPSVMGRLGLALAWTLAFDEAMPIIDAASDRMGVDDPDAAADYLADATRALTIAGYQRGAWRCAERGLSLVAARRDRTWIWLKATDITRRRAEDPDDPGLLTDTPEVLELSAVARDAPLTPPERLFLTNYVAPRSRAEALERRLRDVAALPCYDDQGFALAVLRDGVAQSEREGRHGLLSYYLATLARALISLGDLPAAREAIDRARDIVGRLAYPSTQQLIVLAADNDLRLALDEGLEDMLDASGARGPALAPEYHWAMAAVRAATARTCASVGRADQALLLLDGIPRALEAAPPWITIYAKTACDAAATLWLLGKTDHAARVERCLRDKLLPTGLRDYLREVRVSLGQMCALQGRHDEARAWFADARRILDRAGARTLRGIVDYDEALMVARQGSGGDAAAGLALARAALEQFRPLGMTGWARRATALVEGWHAPRGTRAAAPSGTTIFRREGDVWLVVFEGREIRLRDCRGMAYLATLLAAPRREIHVTDLVRVATPPRAGGARRTTEAAGTGVEVRADLGDAGASIDPAAAAVYRRRLEDLRERLRDAEAYEDIGGAAQARREIDFLTTELAGGTGRAIASHSERARVAVTKNIASALRRIRAAHPSLGEHLAATIHRGYFCSYTPDPRVDVAWLC